MTWYSDLAPCDYFGAEVAEQFRAVGWLSRGKDYTTGDVSEQVFEKLCQLLQNPWNPVACTGLHECELCRFTGGSATSRFKEYTITGTSGQSLFVPGDGVLYIAPESIGHYIDAHGYQPPEAFITAVMKCPEMRSIEYLKAILKNGGRRLVSNGGQ